jgi:hypothetical protein
MTFGAKGQSLGPDTTLTADWSVAGDDERLLLDEASLVQWLSAQFQMYPGCEAVRVQEVLRLDKPDTEGCNWSRTLFLDSAGVPAEDYSLAYAVIVDMGRKAFNLKT